jgi:hypothetical protein
MRTPVRLFLLAAACAAAAACESPSEPPPAPLPSFEIVTGDGQTDTVDARLAAPLAVIVRDSTGRPLSAVQVFFESVGFGKDPVVYPDGPGRLATDATGRAGTPLRAGTLAGAARIIIRVPSLGYVDTATYTVLPGAAAGVVALPEDTALYVARTVPLRASVVDRHGNRRPDAVAVAVGSGPLAAEGGQLRTTAIGRASWIASAGAVADTGWISVVPQGRIAGHWLHQVTGDTARITFMDLDGSGAASFDIGYWWQPEQEWAPNGTHLVMNDGGQTFGSSVNHIAFATPAGVLTRVLPDDVRLRETADPTWSRDGAWIYFTAVPDTVRGLPNDYRKPEIWRARADGTAVERVGPAATYYEGDSHPSVSADGTRVVYASQRSPAGLRIEHLGTGSIRSIPGGHQARWSPVDANLVAYGVPASGLGGSGVEIRLMRADGTPVGGQLGPAEYVYITFSWSPDGRWLIADRTGSGITDLIEVATGQVLPVTSLPARLWDPVWKP